MVDPTMETVRTSRASALARSSATCWMIDGEASRPAPGAASERGDDDAAICVALSLPRIASSSSASGPTTHLFSSAMFNSTETAAWS